MSATQQDQAMQEIADEFISQKYDKLIHAIEEITESKFPHCLMNIHYVATEEDETQKTSCACGHQNLKYVNHMTTTNGEDFILGSVCVGNLLLGLQQQNDGTLIQVINAIERIYNKSESEVKKIKDKKQLEKNLPCLACKCKVIKPNYEYKSEIRKHFCGDCVIKKDRVLCSCCKHKSVKFEKDYRGNYKVLCYDCWKLKK